MVDDICFVCSFETNERFALGHCVKRYHCFAGREASRAMGLLSFDESELANTNISDLGAFAKSKLLFV